MAANGDHVAVIGFPFDLDPTMGGALYRDADGDTLTYEVVVSGSPPGLTLSGTRITGIPTGACTCSVTVNVSDGRGGFGSETFGLELKSNSAPQVARRNENLAVNANTGVDYDATQAGATFRDPDRHALTYEVTILSAPPGFSVQGARIIGMFGGPGFVSARIEARDGFGGVAQDTFALVMPAPIGTRPSLPAQPFTYEDAQLPLNNVFTQNPDRRLANDTTPADNPITNAGATLGRVLFYDKRLSITNTHSCGSCHEQAHGFTSAQRFPTGATGVATRRSPMALTNVRYNHQNRYFSDQRAGPLEQLALMPIESREELGSATSALVAELAATDYYGPLFLAAFGSTQITADRISKALAQFLRSLISYQSKFDRAHYSVDPEPRPDPSTVLTAQEQRGFEVFIESQCFHCHQTSAFDSPWPDNNGIDASFSDPGTGFGRFRVASIRNIAVSDPYMHDGRFATLREVIDHYSSGVKMSPDLSSLLGGGRSEPFLRNFPEEDKAALEAFFNTLTDTVFLSDPKFSDPFR